MHVFMSIMEAIQQMQSAWGSFGGHTPSISPVGPSTASRVTAPTGAAQTSGTINSPIGGVDLSNKVKELRNHWVDILPESFANSEMANSEGLSMITMNGERVPYSPDIAGRAVMLDVNTHYPVAGQDGIDKYWEARTANGLDYSKLSAPLMGSSDEQYNDETVRRLAIDGTASEIFPGDHMRDNIAESTKRRVDLTYTYSALNSYDSPVHSHATPQEKQNLHEAGTFAIASATFLESGGNFDDAALDKFLNEQIEAEELDLQPGDGPRAQRLAKLGEVTKAIIDGDVEIDDVIEHGIVPKDQAKKFEASVKTVKHGKIGADISKVDNNTSDSDVRKSIASSKTVGSISNTAAKNVVKVKNS